MNCSKNNHNSQIKRLRRYRFNETMRSLMAAPMPGPEKFVMPLFVVEGSGVRNPIDSMPGQFRFSIDTLEKEVAELRDNGIKSILLFGVISDNSLKTPDGSYAFSETGLVQRAVRHLKSRFDDVIIITDVCFCEYTTHGHCGILENGNVNNDATLELLAKASLSLAEAGADILAPSAMMDGQILTIRNALDSSGFSDRLVMSYSTKFASSMYGPFRDAAGSAPTSGDRKAYQADYRNLNAALLESEADEAEGADILMVKPALFYLDIISKIKESTRLPLAVYNVSGEYSMLAAQAQNGWGDLRAMVRESVAALNRAGADIIISYWANQYTQLIAD
jgi:porphobilinogen synthase